MLGLPGAAYHLEFTQHENAIPYPAVSEDHLLVFYIPDRNERDKMVNRLKEMGYQEATPENPYWEKAEVTIVDPDGWRIVLQNSYTLNYGK
jgi:uncharacterized glyoxalase superfamily protein PhnB